MGPEYFLLNGFSSPATILSCSVSHSSFCTSKFGSTHISFGLIVFMPCSYTF